MLSSVRTHEQLQHGKYGQVTGKAKLEMGAEMACRSKGEYPGRKTPAHDRQQRPRAWDKQEEMWSVRSYCCCWYFCLSERLRRSLSLNGLVITLFNLNMNSFRFWDSLNLLKHTQGHFAVDLSPSVILEHICPVPVSTLKWSSFYLLRTVWGTTFIPVISFNLLNSSVSV